MKTKKISLLVACGAALCVLPATFAKKDGDKGEEYFKRMDTNGDGKISRAEHAAFAKQMFNECDANHDGIVTAAEMDASTKKHGAMPNEKSAAEKIREIDTNGDGQLTTAEHEAGTDKMFDRLDTNHDGFLSKDEVQAGMKLMQKGA